MFTTLALAGAAHALSGHVAALLAVLSTLAVGIITSVSATTQWKNSGILRYRFGFDLNNVGPDPHGRPVLIGGAATVILNLLGADTDVTVDCDNQVFGESPGHAAITGALGSMFSGSNVAQRDANPT